MNKKKKENKNLQKRLCAIVHIYMEQKGKSNRNQLKEFIEQKMEEIIAFRDSLEKKKKTPKKQKQIIETEVVTATLKLQPSAALVAELHNNQKDNEELTNAETLS